MAARGATRLSKLVGITAATIGVIYGYDQGSIAAALLSLKGDFDLGTGAQQLVVTSVVAGQILGALVGGRLANAVGRRLTMVAVATAFAVFAVACGLAPDEPFLVAARFLLGVAIGVSVVAAPLYIAESAPTAVRGSLLVTYQVATIAGIVLAYFIGVALASGGHWRWMLGLSAVPAVAIAVVIARLPDTPRWYAMRGRREEAREVIAGGRDDVEPDAELALIEEDLAHEERGTFRELFSSPFTRAGIFVLVFGFLVQITGINGITYYSPTILQDVGFASDTDAILGAAVVQLAGLLVTCVAVWLVERRGRRPVLLSGIATMVVANAVLVVSFASGESSALSLIGILLFVMGFNFGFGATVWIYSSESLPSRLRSVGASVLLAANLSANLVIGLAFLSIFESLGGTATFAIFGALSVVAAVFCWRFAPETQGRELEEIRGYWENGGKWPAEPPEASGRFSRSTSTSESTRSRVGSS
jgi:SP family galactose:H+ symporter-like MFS transporter